MNKKIITLSIALAMASSTVSAVNLYDEEGYKVDFYGDLEVNYKQKVGANQDAQLNIDDADFGVKVSSNLESGQTIFGQVSIDADSGDNNDEVNLDTLFVGVGFDNGVKVLAGRAWSITDSIGISTDYEVGGTYEAWGAGKNIITDRTNETARIDYSTGMFEFAAGIVQDSDGNDKTDDFTQIELNANVQFNEMVGMKTYYVTAENDAIKTEQDLMTVELRINFDKLALATNYATSSLDIAGKEVDTDAYGLTAKYTFDQVSVSGGWSTQDTDGGSDVSKWYANVGYDMNKYSKVFAEIADTDVDGEDLGYAVGMRVFF